MIKKNIGIVTFPLLNAQIPPLTHFVEIINSIINDEIYIVTGNILVKNIENTNIKNKLKNNKNLYVITHKTGNNSFSRIVRYIYTQIKVLINFLKLSKNAKTWIFPIGGETLLPTIFAAKLFRKNVILTLTSSTQKMVEANKDWLGKVDVFLAKINYRISDKLVIYSSNMIKEWDLEKYSNKIIIAHEHFVDFKSFKITKDFHDREKLVGFIGRLSKEKGILEFINSIPLILEKRADLNFVIGGDGPLQYEVREFIDNNFKDKVKFIGWIPREKLPDYLNELKLLVVPSYTEGLPNIVLEALACGTPVLAAQVGALPDLIKVKETGFILKNNNPEGIADGVLDSFECNQTKVIIDCAKRYISKHYSFNNTAVLWKKLLMQFYND